MAKKCGSFGRPGGWASAPTPRRLASRSATSPRSRTTGATSATSPPKESSGNSLPPPGTDPTDLMVLAEKVPESIRRRVLERPDVFRKLALLGDATPDRLVGRPDPAPVGSPAH